MALSVSAMAVPNLRPAPRGASPFGKTINKTSSPLRAYAPASEATTPDDLLKDPEGTVFSGPFNSQTAYYTGFQNSDQGRAENPSKFYQYYSGCPYTISGVRVIGLFNYWDDDTYDWIMCGDRPGYDDRYTMTNPVTFEVSFYKIDDEGMPGECVFKKNYDLKGRYTGLMSGEGDNKGPLMEFIVELGEDIKLESGYMSFSAAKLPEGNPTCTFSLFTATSSFGHAIIDMEPYGMMSATMPCIFSLLGPGDIAANKLLKINGINNLVETSSGDHETVRVSLSNMGAQTINDIELQLIVDGTTVSTERPAISLASLADRDYVFAKRIDLSEAGEHTVTVINTTPGDEKISLDKASVTTKKYAEGERAESAAMYSYEEDVLVKVTVGDINNESEPTEEGYEDFTALSTDITSGQTLELRAEFNPDGEGGYIGAWVDWNGDGLFNGEGEFMGYLRNDFIPIEIPEGIIIKKGPKVLRVVGNSNSTPTPHGKYYYGQTEDYTLNVISPNNSPVATPNVSFLESNDAQEISSLDFLLANEGDAQLNAQLSVDYVLPAIYTQREIITPAPDAKPMTCPVRAAAENASDDNAVHTLRYDGGVRTAVGLGNYSEALFGQLCPAEMMQSVKGLKLASIDAYIEEVPESAFAQVYEMTDGAYKLVAEKEFTPQSASWNHVEFDTPITVSGADLIYAVRFTGMTAGKYYIGIDAISAVAGYGDICNVGGDTWWSMADLGIDNNFCIRASLKGDRTPEISWLTLDKKELTVAPGNNEKVTATLNGKNLLDGTYEARVIIASNDPLTPMQSFPVYLTKGMSTGINTIAVNNCSVKIEGESLVIVSDKDMTSARVTNTAGMTMAAANAAATQNISLNLSACNTGMYIVTVTYADGTHESMKMTIARY